MLTTTMIQAAAQHCVQNMDWQAIELAQQQEKDREMATLYARLDERNADVPIPNTRLSIPRAAHNPRPITDRALMREIEAFQRFELRHHGVRKVLWAWLEAKSYSEPDLLTVIWIRHTNGYQERVEVNRHVAYRPGLGKLADLGLETRAVFDQYVQPRLKAEQADEAIRVGEYHVTTARMSELRDHPFKPGVREFYEMTTQYIADPYTKHQVWAAAKFCRFRCVRTTNRVQLKGERLLLITGTQLNNVAWGRFPTNAQLSDAMLEGIRSLIWELARKKLSPGALRQLEVREQSIRRGRVLGTEELGDLLRAVQLPEMMNQPALLGHVQFLDGRAYRQVRRERPSLKAYLNKLVGALPRDVLTNLTPARLSVAVALKASGLSSPDVRAGILRAFAEHNPGATEAVTGDLNLKWYVELLGEDRAGRLLKDAFAQPRALSTVKILADDTEPMLRTVRAAMPEWHLDKAYVGLQALHDHLSLLQSKLRTANHALPSAADPKLAHLDLTVNHPAQGALTFRRATCTHDLIHWGQVLHNCVGSYAASALRGDVVIVVASDPAGTPKAVLEVARNQVRQYKLNFNAPPSEGPDLEVAAAYVAHARLNPGQGDLHPLNAPERATSRDDVRVEPAPRLPAPQDTVPWPGVARLPVTAGPDVWPPEQDMPF